MTDLSVWDWLSLLESLSIMVTGMAVTAVCVVALWRKR